MKRIIGIGLGLGLGLGFCPMVLWAFETQPQLYRPFTETPKHPPVRIESKQAGVCQEPSRISTRQDAWRCVSQGQVHDPCFVNRFGDHKTVVCPRAPWLGESVLLSLNEPVEDNASRQLDMSRHYPWAVELNTGQRCLAVEPGQTYEHLPIHYACSRDTVLMGHIQRCSGRWKMLQHTPQGVSTVDITFAWF